MEKHGHFQQLIKHEVRLQRAEFLVLEVELSSGDHGTCAKSVGATPYPGEVRSSEAQPALGVTPVTEALWLMHKERECTGLWHILGQRQRNQEHQGMVFCISEKVVVFTCFPGSEFIHRHLKKKLK